MGIRKPILPAVFWPALLLALTLAVTACHSDKRQASLPAPQANAPALAPVTALGPQAIPDAKPAPEQPSQAAPQPKPDPVADLIANAEKEYQAAEEKFKAGDLEAAKRGFDRALDQLLQSPQEIRA